MGLAGSRLRGSGLGVLHGRAAYRTDLGEAGMGRVLGVGRAPDVHVGALAAVPLLSDLAHDGRRSGPSGTAQLVLWRIYFSGGASGLRVVLGAGAADAAA